jgi:integrase
MPRQPKLRKKKVGRATYWYTEAGGPTYFGNVEAVPYLEARRLFAVHVQILLDERNVSKEQGFTAGDLIDLFLEWVEKHRSHATYTTRLIYCSRFGDLKVRNVKIADLPADKVRASDLEGFLERMEGEGLGPQTRLHAETSVRHCWNWGARHPSPTPYLPPAFRPFASVERTHVPRKALTEGDLITREEVAAVFACGEIGLDQFRRHGLMKTAELRGAGGLERSGDFTELLKCFYHTGARTDELASCEAGDFLPRTSQVVLGRHKRSRTQRQPTVRHITLNPEALAIFQRHCEGRRPEDKLFLNEDGRPWTVRNLAKRFERVKEVAKALGMPVRNEITIYDFRHLWISEALMAGNDVVTVARMAGTSIAMIERVYGHFSNQHLQQAQERLDRARGHRPA